MRHRLPPAVACLAAVAAFAAPAMAAPPDTPVPLSAALQAALHGRTAGSAVDCISLPRNRSSSIVDHAAIIYKESANRWYVNFPAGGSCSSLDPRRALVTRVPSTRLCRGDLVSVVDLPLGFDYGACPLGDFIPYTK